MKSRDACAPARGFTLIEVLVALAILGMTLGLLLRIFAVGSRSAKMAERSFDAMSVAGSLLAETGVVAPIAPAVTQGIYNHEWGWRRTIQPLPGETRVKANPPPIALPYLVSVEIWTLARKGLAPIKIRTVRLGPPPRKPGDPTPPPPL
jgi:general secretion pathway protein I